ncbi:hypothetical protein TEA_012310 [Camellia sinensis var. sinensis]|uniref:SWIB domain-containing protein n=1 Tax=Camellia sinensis var. sinensis TaxID=542762 RepID=A0A4S4D4L5_CAMSN|nr:hypothetical protein TEA_012310 [Camellia sinensis var. sinensis]
MATMSLGVFSSFLGGETASLAKSSSLSSSSLWLGVRSLPTSQANLRAVTSATASKPSTATQKREPRGIMKPGRVSPEMQAFLGGVSEIPRTQVLKQIWAYIKQHNLQMIYVLVLHVLLAGQESYELHPSSLGPIAPTWVRLLHMTAEVMNLV